MQDVVATTEGPPRRTNAQTAPVLQIKAQLTCAVVPTKATLVLEVVQARDAPSPAP
jgi:hypothetical protein